MTKESAKDLKKFIIRLIVFMFAFLVMLSLLNSYFLKLVLAQTAVQRSDNQFKEYASSTKILFLGDSHSRNAIDPELIPHSFNYAFSGENYIQTYYKLKYVLDNNKDIKAVILPLDLHSFFIEMAESSKNEWFWKKYIDYLELSRNDQRVSYVQKMIISQFPVIDNGGEFLNNLKGGQKLSILSKGYSIENDNFAYVNDKTENAKNRVSLQLNGKGVLDNVLLMYFEKTLEYARLKGVKVYLVKFPISKEYHSVMMDAVEEENDYSSKIDTVLQEHKEATVLDFQNIYFDRPDFFHNSDHLNRDGSLDFTKKLKKILVK